MECVITLKQPKESFICTGLCCAALLARYGQRVIVCEAHYLAGGAAQSFDQKGYQFDAGPSFFAGLSGKFILKLKWMKGNNHCQLKLQ